MPIPTGIETGNSLITLDEVKTYVLYASFNTFLFLLIKTILNDARNILL